ncbi:MAG TPA: ABC transporter permease [Patescibacteria group bacterium]|nr:ABC transporter permease [Patescibacteria group bacterium]
MRWHEKLRMRLRMLFHRRRESERLDAEMRFHLEQQTAEYSAAGMSTEEARCAALRAFGSPAALREDTRDVWGWSRIEQAWQNARLGVRTLARTPGFALITIAVMAIGMGANVALFTVVRSVLLRPLPFPEPDRLVRVYEHSADDKFPLNWNAGGIYAAWKESSHSFTELAIQSSGDEYNLSGAGGQLPEKIRAATCSWNLFATLGVEPAVGRSFTAKEDSPAANGTVILSWGLWKRRYGGDHAILSKTIRLDAKPYTVVGVMPAWFAFPDQSAQLWAPIYHEQPGEEMRSLGSHSFEVIGRLKPGVGAVQAEAELAVVTRRIHDAHPENPFISKGAHARPLLESVVGEVKAPLYLLLAATGCVLLIACLNVANLLVARAAARKRELALRMALGGSRVRLLFEHLTESVLLSAAGGAAGILLAWVAVRWFVGTRQDISRVEAIHPDGMVALFAGLLIVLCGVFSGLISALSIRDGQILNALQESSRANSAGPGRAGLRKTLLAIEVGLTVILLVSAGLLMKSYERIRETDPGCITKDVLTMQFTLSEAKYPKPAERLNFYLSLVERVRALPGVEGAGLTRVVPGGGYGGDSGFTVAEHPPLPPGTAEYALTRWADAGYFAALGIPLVRGRIFDTRQQPDGPRQALISDEFARKYFPGEDPVGKHLLTLGTQSFEITGVVGDTRYRIAEAPQPMMYFALGGLNGMEFGQNMSLVVRSDRDVTALALPVERVIQQLDPELPVSNVLTMEQVIGRSMRDASFDATLVSAFAVLSLLLAAVGLFGVASYTVSQRTTELGIRLALGAPRQSVLRLVLLDGLRPAIAGLALGLVGSLGAAGLMRSLLYGMDPADPPVYVLVVGTLLLAAACACALPAWRATRVDPMRALRAE